MEKPDSAPLPDEPEEEVVEELLVALEPVLVPDPLPVVSPVELAPLTALVTVGVLPFPVPVPVGLVTPVVSVATATEEVETADVVVVPFPGGTWVLPTVAVTLGTELATPVTSGMLVSPAEKFNILLVVALKFVFVNAIS